MPDGQVHSFASIALAAGAGYGLPRLGLAYPPLSLVIAGGCLAGLLLTPDLDVDTGSMSDTWAEHTFGGLIGLIWWLAWRPYAWIVPHRSPFSHWPLVGTSLRVVYVWGITWVICTISHMILPFAIPQIKVVPWWLPWAFVGLASSDLLHWVLDNTFTAHGFRRWGKWKHKQKKPV